MKNGDEKLKKYLEILEETKLLTKELEALKEEFKEEGSFSTRNYICMVVEQERETLAPIAEFQKRLGLQILVELELLRKVSYKVVKVGKKNVLN